MTPAQAIYAAFPSDKQPHRAIRFNLLRAVHAANNAETAIYLLADYIAAMIDNPPWSLWCGPDEIKDLANRLRELAGDLDKAASALDAAKPLWSSPTDSLTGAAHDVIDHGPDRVTPTPTDQTPF